MPEVTGRIIRILDEETMVINLGSRDGITKNSVFRILGEPESIVDPFSDEDLGRLTLVKARVKASQVQEKYTVATIRWGDALSAYLRAANADLSRNEDKLPSVPSISSSAKMVEEIDGQLPLGEENVRHWEARSAEPIRLGDIVEVTVPDNPEKASTCDPETPE